MKTLCTILVMSAGLVLAAQATEPTLAEINQELTLTKARLELAEAKLALAAKGNADLIASSSVTEGS